MAKKWYLPVALCLCACSSEPQNEILLPMDPGFDEAWTVVDPAQVGLSQAKLEAARAYVFKPEYYTQAVVIIRHGYLAAEWYVDDSGPESLTNSWSIGKSFTSTLIGMAIEDGLIESVDVPMTDYIEEWEGTDKANIKLRDVLAMSSGLDWIEDYEELNTDGGTSDMFDMVLDTDPMAIAIDQPVRSPAGESWYYSSGDTMLLGRVLRAATGKSAAELVGEKLAKPLGMSEVHWWQDANGDTYTFCCVDAPARDFARFGQLFLQQGVWGGQQLVPATWVEAATSSQAEANPGYGYQWWINHPDSADGNWPSLPETAYFALGHNGQYIGVFPDQDLVVVRMGQYIVPETDDWIAREGLFTAGVYSDNIGPTGTRAPEGDWNDDTFFKLVLEALQD